MIKPPVLLSVLGLLTGLLWAAPANPSAGDSRQIRQRIDALLKRRQQPTPLPVDPPNPFALVAAVSGGLTPVREPTVAGGGEPAMPAVVVGNPDNEIGSANTAELLARLSSRLRITGMIRLGEQVHVIINDSPWKEGDYMILNQGSHVIRLQVMRIVPGQLTLRLEEAELVIRF